MIQGFTDPRFRLLHETFAQSFEGDPLDMNVELGASVSVYLDGQPVVDLWGGHMDASGDRPWNEDTIVNVQSVGKGVLATCAHIALERGMLELDRPIAEYWPEFAAKGKAEIPVRWALTHSAGLPAWEAPEPGMGYDWDRVSAAMADSRPDLRPGVDRTYHPYTYGIIVGELLRRATGRSVDDFLAAEVTEPWGVDFQYGVRPADRARTATFTRMVHRDNLDANRAVMPTEYVDIAVRGLDVLNLDEDYNSDAWRSCCFPAANGHTNGRALARLYGGLALGGALDGVRIIASETLERASAVQWSGRHLIIPMTTNMGLGYILNSPSFPAGPNADAFGHAGFGGAFGFADRKSRIGFGYTPNKLWLGEELSTGERCDRLVRALYACLEA